MVRTRARESEFKKITKRRSITGPVDRNRIVREGERGERERGREREEEREGKREREEKTELSEKPALCRGCVP